MLSSSSSSSSSQGPNIHIPDFLFVKKRNLDYKKYFSYFTATSEFDYEYYDSNGRLIQHRDLKVIQIRKGHSHYSKYFFRPHLFIHHLERFIHSEQYLPEEEILLDFSFLNYLKLNNDENINLEILNFSFNDKERERIFEKLQDEIESYKPLTDDIENYMIEHNEETDDENKMIYFLDEAIHPIVEELYQFFKKSNNSFQFLYLKEAEFSKMLDKIMNNRKIVPIILDILKRFILNRFYKIVFESLHEFKNIIAIQISLFHEIFKGKIDYLFTKLLKPQIINKIIIAGWDKGLILDRQNIKVSSKLKMNLLYLFDFIHAMDLASNLCLELKNYSIAKTSNEKNQTKMTRIQTHSNLLCLSINNCLIDDHVYKLINDNIKTIYNLYLKNCLIKMVDEQSNDHYVHLEKILNSFKQLYSLIIHDLIFIFPRGNNFDTYLIFPVFSSENKLKNLFEILAENENLKSLDFSNNELVKRTPDEIYNLPFHADMIYNLIKYLFIFLKKSKNLNVLILNDLIPQDRGVHRSSREGFMYYILHNQWNIFFRKFRKYFLNNPDSKLYCFDFDNNGLMEVGTFLNSEFLTFLNSSYVKLQYMSFLCSGSYLTESNFKFKNLIESIIMSNNKYYYKISIPGSMRNDLVLYKLLQFYLLLNKRNNAHFIDILGENTGLIKPYYIQEYQTAVLPGMNANPYIYDFEDYRFFTNELFLKIIEMIPINVPSSELSIIVSSQSNTGQLFLNAFSEKFKIESFQKSLKTLELKESRLDLEGFKLLFIDSGLYKSKSINKFSINNCDFQAKVYEIIRYILNHSEIEVFVLKLGQLDRDILIDEYYRTEKYNPFFKNLFRPYDDGHRKPPLKDVTLQFKEYHTTGISDHVLFKLSLSSLAENHKNLNQLEILNLSFIYHHLQQNYFEDLKKFNRINQLVMLFVEIEINEIQNLIDVLKECEIDHLILKFDEYSIQGVAENNIFYADFKSTKFLMKKLMLNLKQTSNFNQISIQVGRNFRSTFSRDYSINYEKKDEPQSILPTSSSYTLSDDNSSSSSKRQRTAARKLYF